MMHFEYEVGISLAEVWKQVTSPLYKIKIFSYTLLSSHKVCELLLCMDAWFFGPYLVNSIKNFFFRYLLKPYLPVSLDDFWLKTRKFHEHFCNVPFIGIWLKFFNSLICHYISTLSVVIIKENHVLCTDWLVFKKNFKKSY
jgi:hypothetical protein